MADTIVTEGRRQPKPLVTTGDGSVAETNALGRVQTNTARKLHGKNYMYAEPLVQATASRENLAPGSDEWSLTPEEYTLYGIKDTEVHCWRRDPGYWKQYEMGDRLRQSMRETPGLHAVLDGYGELIFNGDQVLCAKPRTDIAIEEKQSADNIKNYLNRVEKGKGDIEGASPRFKREEFVDAAERVEQEHQKNLSMGVIGPTGYMDYSHELTTAEGRARIEKLEEKFRNGGHHVGTTEGKLGDVQEARRAEGAQSVERAAAGTKFPAGSIPANVGIRRPAGFKEAASASRSRR